MVLLLCLGQIIYAQETTILEKQNDSVFVERVASLSEKTKQKTLKNLSSSPKQTVQRQLLEETKVFRTYCSRNMPSQQAQKWYEKLKLNKLEHSLRQGESPVRLLEEILTILQEDHPELQRSGFVRLEKALSRQVGVLKLPAIKGKQDEIEYFFDSLPDLIGEYCQSPDADKAKVISESITYLDENCDASELVTLLREYLVKSNLYIRVSSDVVAKLLRQEIDEPIDVNENILGTQVRGAGKLTGRLSGTFVPRADAAVIRVTLDGELKTSTVGSNGPARVHSDNTTTVKTVKDIVVSQSGIVAAPAKTDAQQLSLINRVNYTRNGPLVRMVAPNQIRQRKPASDTESERLTKRRFNSRLDQEVNGHVDRLNKILKDTTGSDESLQLTFDQLRTNDRELSLSACAGTRHQLGAPTTAPAQELGRGIFVQCHESFLQNVGAHELGGKTLIEKQVIADIKKRFPQIIETFVANGNSDESSLTVAFSDTPIDLAFADNCISVTIEAVSIEREGNSYPGMTLEFRFRIENIDGGFQLVATDSPEVLPIGFDKEKDQLSARETTIRAIVMKKLERAFEKPIELKESVIEAENGTLTLKPTQLSTTDGWLSVGLEVVNWVPKQDAN